MKEKRNNRVVPSPYPGGNGYLLSDDWWGDDHYLAITPEYVTYMRELQTKKIERVATHWLNERPKLKTLCTPQYLSQMTLREAHEFAASRVFHKEEHKKTDVNTLIKLVGDSRRMELGDVLFYMALLRNKLNIPLTYNKINPPNDEVQAFEEQRWKEQMPVDTLLTACVYFIDRNITKPTVTDLFNYTHQIIFRYQAWQQRLPPPYPENTTRETMRYDQKNWDLLRVINKVKNKNDKQLPKEFFREETTPFEDPQTALDCLGLFRNTQIDTTQITYLRDLNIKIKAGDNVAQTTLKSLKQIEKSNIGFPSEQASDLISFGQWR